ncbi:4Fe-4S dicluster domain-containing protein [Streptomyces phaeochromogenes]
MTYVITEPCIGTKEFSCVDVCPVDCISPGPEDPDSGSASQLYIDPYGCIDCGACMTACPVDAPMPADQVPAHWLKYIEINAKYFGH